MKKLFFIFFLLFISGTVFSLTLKAEQNGYEKGSDIPLSGSCDAGEVHKIKAELGNLQIFEEQINCFEGKFSYTHSTSYLDPSGNWTITLFTQNSETQIIVQIEPVPESAFYRITFLSPAVFTFQRGEPVFISVEITDSGNPVLEAEVVMFDVFGRRIQLKDEGNGIYDINYGIPFNSQIGKWDLFVTAQKNQESKNYGGERKIETNIVQTQFDFEFIEPENRTFEQSDSVPFRVKVRYPSGQKLSKVLVETAELRVNNSTFPMEMNSEGELVLNYYAQESGNLIHTIFVEDIAGNQAEANLELTITCSVTCLLKSYGLIVLAFILVFGVVAKLFYSKTKKSFDLLALQKEREKTMELIKNIQTEYFGKAVMPASSYKSNLAEYKARLIDLDEKIKQMKKKIEETK
ncbi:MAG TPA: hypothetical protein VFF13_04435 [archaeon]|nr:hypothetical protein [archaeon]